MTTSWAALDDLPCSQVSIFNNTGADLLVRMASETDADHQNTIPDQISVAIACNNANNVEIKAASGTTGVEYTAEP